MPRIAPLWKSAHRRTVVRAGGIVLGASACAAMLVLWSWSRLATATTAHNSEEAALSAAAMSQQELAPLTADLPRREARTLALQAAGFDKSFDRVAWAESVTRAVNALDPIGYTAEIGHALPQPMPPGLQEWYDARGIAPPVIQGVTLELQIQGLHEDELADVLKKVTTGGGDITRIERCKFVRRPDDVGVDANCTLRHYGIAKQVAAEVAP
jgi:hypothetical protein